MRQKFIMESHNPNTTHGWGWTGLKSDSLDDLMESGRAYAARHHADRIKSMTTFRIVESAAVANRITGESNPDVVHGTKVWYVGT